MRKNMKQIKMKWFKRGFASLLLGAICLTTPMQVMAESSSNYCYDTETEKYFTAPVAYEVDQVIYAKDLNGVDSLKGIASTFVKDDLIYVTTAQSIIILDSGYKVKEVLSEYTDLEGNKATVSGVEGIFVTDEGLLYVCEPANGRILVFDKNLKLIQNFGQPTGLDLENISYQPKQVVVDSLNRMYVIAKNIYEGILEIDSNNQFQRYFGETSVAYSALDLIWRQLATEEQKAKQTLWLPTEYSSMAMGGTGFIYTSISYTEEETPIRLLNVHGSNILAYNEEFDLYPKGDIVYSIAGSGTTGASSLTYIDCNEYGMYTVLDSMRNRVFTYDENGNLLFVFGGQGDKEGCFRNPVSVRFVGDDIIVADKMSESITVMTPTLYGQKIIDATKLDYMGEETQAIAYWEEILEMNPNLELAYDALGKAALRNKDYDTAEKYFKFANNRTYYSKAYSKTRADIIEENITWVVIVVVVLIVGSNVFKQVKKRTKKGLVS